MKRAEAHEAVNRIFDRLEADDRSALGMGMCVPHIGYRPAGGHDHSTVETETEVLHHKGLITPLAGAVHALQLAVSAHFERTKFSELETKVAELETKF